MEAKLTLLEMRGKRQVDLDTMTLVKQDSRTGNETRQVYARKAHKERLVQDFKSLPTHRQLYNMPN